MRLWITCILLTTVAIWRPEIRLKLKFKLSTWDTQHSFMEKKTNAKCCGLNYHCAVVNNNNTLKTTYMHSEATMKKSVVGYLTKIMQLKIRVNDSQHLRPFQYSGHKWINMNKTLLQCIILIQATNKKIVYKPIEHPLSIKSITRRHSCGVWSPENDHLHLRRPSNMINAPTIDGNIRVV